MSGKGIRGPYGSGVFALACAELKARRRATRLRGSNFFIRGIASSERTCHVILSCERLKFTHRRGYIHNRFSCLLAIHCTHTTYHPTPSHLSVLRIMEKADASLETSELLAWPNVTGTPRRISGSRTPASNCGQPQRIISPQSEKSH